MTLVPLIVAVPLAAAALIGVFGRWLRDGVVDAVAPLAAIGAAVLAAIVLAKSAHGTLVYWFGGWRPEKGGGFPLGVSFTVDRIGAGLAFFTLLLAAAMLVYSWHYMEDAHQLYEVLVLLFAAGLAGFVLSGDLFNMFVFFELMSVAAYALTAYRVEEEPALQAAFNFAVSNSIGSFLVLFGIALLYGRTGSLNLAEIGLRLRGHGGLVVVAFALIVCGFLVKAAIVPFHFWLADAYAIAPAPVCVLFAGVMSDLGLYAVARVYWTIFDGPFAGFHHEIRDVLLAAGATTAILAAVMCTFQRHLKRLLAYATISELGCVLIGVALLNRDGIAGAALTVVAHGLAKAALFLACGVLLINAGAVDELLLYGAGRRLRLVGLAWLIGAVALVSPPFAGTFTGHALIDDGAGRLGLGWVPIVVAGATIVSTGAILRAGARVFLGVGSRSDPLLSEEPREPPGPREHPNIALMTAVMLALGLAGLAVGVSSSLATMVRQSAHGFVDSAGYADAVLRHRSPGPVADEPWHASAASVAWALTTLFGSLAWAGLSLYREHLPGVVVRGVGRAAAPLKAAHSGHVGDYAAWVTFGTAVIGTAFALSIR